MNKVTINFIFDWEKKQLMFCSNEIFKFVDTGFRSDLLLNVN